ncbi:MAG: hypothetical protein ISR65_17890 [Bacteriovoracaceae bacterium]|nr:hypothetical protein [Bacteriovoracaceae bacterium]
MLYHNKQWGYFYACVLIILGQMGSAEGSYFYQFNYYIQSGDTFSSILHQFVKKKSGVDDLSVQMTVNNNRDVKSFRNMSPFYRIKLFISHESSNFHAIDNYAKWSKFKFKREDGKIDIVEGFIDKQGPVDK